MELFLKGSIFYNQPIIHFHTPSVFLLLYMCQEILAVFLKCVVL